VVGEGHRPAKGVNKFREKRRSRGLVVTKDGVLILLAVLYVDDTDLLELTPIIIGCDGTLINPSINRGA